MALTLQPNAGQPTHTDGFVTVGDNLKLSYRHWSAVKAGNTQPVFLLIHGLASGLRIWDFVAAELVRLTGGTVVAFDQRGHGLSDKPDMGYDNAQIVADDFQLATALKLENPIVVGHSWGATIALAYAATHPGLVKGLVLVDGGLGNMQDRKGLTWERAERELAPPDFAGTPKDAFLDFYRRGEQGRYLGPVWNAGLEDIILNIVQLRPDNTVAPRLSRTNHMKILRALWESDNYALAQQVHCPVLLISAETLPELDNSPLAEWFRLKREGAARLQSRLACTPHTEFVVMPETIHDIPLQRPHELTQAIVRFGSGTGILPGRLGL